MTLEQAKEILKTYPETKEEIVLYKQALALVGSYWATDV